MKIRSLLFSLMCLIALNVSITSCSDDDDDYGRNDSGSTIELPQKRAYILNEGTQGANNASISFYCPDQADFFVKDIFQTQNNAKLGDTGQDMIEYRNSIYVAVNGSSYMTRLNTAGVEQARHAFTINGATPRYMAADDGYIYVTLYGGKVVKLDAQTLEEKASLSLGNNLEDIVECNNKLYVANSYKKEDAQFVYLSDVFVIDTKTFTLEKTLTVTVNPNKLTEANDKVFLISYGDYNATGYTAQMIDPKDNNKITVIGTATDMVADDERGMIYFVNSETDYSNWPETSTINTFYSYNANTLEKKDASFLKNAPEELASSSVYSMSVNEANGDIYIATTLYSAGNGIIYRFDQNGNFISKFDCGGQNPKKIIFFN